MPHVDITVDGVRVAFRQLADTQARVDQLHATQAEAAHTRKTEAGASVSESRGADDAR